MTDLAGLIVFLLSSFLAAGIGGAITARSVRTWYLTLRKPTWNPPARLFGPVWSVLYLLMAIAAWLVWRGRDAADVRAALALYAAQLALNVLWSFLFFGLRRPSTALIEIALLWFAIAATIAAFWPIDRTAAALLLPYLAWVGFATVLNRSIARSNPGAPARASTSATG